MKKLFYISARTRILDGMKKCVHGVRAPLAINPRLYYIGGFYSEDATTTFNGIREADIVVANLLGNSSIPATEILYAAQFRSKEVIIFCDQNITQPESSYEYQIFSLVAKYINGNKLQIVQAKNEYEALDFLATYGRQHTSQKVVVATNNDGKLRELRELLPDYDLLSLNDAQVDHEVVEDGTTFLDNARKKAFEIQKIVHCPVIADDSGLEIDELNDFPGVLTHRFLGEDATDEERNEMLIKMASGKKARFVCELVFNDGWRRFSEIPNYRGEIVGKIASSPRGKNGFGFDPIFELSDGRTLAELSPEEKNQLSARYLAVIKLALDQ